MLANVNVTALGLALVHLATQLCVTDWLVHNVLELPSSRPLRAAAATLVLSGITVAPAVYGMDVLLGGTLEPLSRILLALLVGVVQTGLVLRLVYGVTLPTACVQGLVLQLTWGALGVLILLCHRLGGFYGGAPLALIIAAQVSVRVRDRELVRRLSRVPPTAPVAHPAGTPSAAT